MAGGKSGPEPDDIMSPAEMKPLLTKSKQEPVSCAFALTAKKEGVILLDKRMKPKAVAAELRKRAAKLKLDLDMQSIRFGRAEVDTDENAGMMNFVVNKESGAAVRAALLPHLKKAGFGKLEITVDAGLEQESDDAEQAGATAAAPTPPPPQPEAPAASATAAPPPPPPADIGALTHTLSDLVKRIAQADPTKQADLKNLAIQAQGALKSGDANGANAVMQQLQKALDSTGGKGADPAAKVAIVKARLAWLGARKKVESDIDAVQKELSAAVKDHAKAADLESGFRLRVEKVMNELDEQLADKLDEVVQAADPAQHQKLVAEAKQIMQRYEKFLASDKTLADLESNPFHPIAVQKTMTATLEILNRTIA